MLGAKFQHYSNSIPRCSMVLEYLPTFTLKKSLSFVGKCTSTMEHMGLLSTTLEHLCQFGW
jgi:hypothetical protein